MVIQNRSTDIPVRVFKINGLENPFSFPNKSEVEANKLAADILMPHDKIDTLIEQIGKHDISFEIIAKRFDISLSALRVRLGII